MADKPNDEPFRRLAEDLRRVGLEALLSLQDRLRRYAGMPGVADETTRTGIREDAVILAIADLLGAHPRPQFRVLDACCGLGGLASHLANNLSGPADRVAYLGIDQNSQHIGRARKLTVAKNKLHSVEYRIGEVWHLPVEWHSTIDLVVLSNTLHELPPHKYPELFAAFNKVIADDEGRICVIDMEELPVGEPEAIAINWKLEEVEAVLRGGGFEVAPSKFAKSVGVFRVLVKHTKNINPGGMLREIRSQIRKKLATLTQDRAESAEEAYADDDSLLNWIVLTGSVARCAEELLLVEQRIEALAEIQPEPAATTS
jgi:ubiquinone/menaquinone biosynthesis C-methylase UbiE